MSVTLPDKTVDFDLRHGELTPSANSIYPAPGVSIHERDSLIMRFTCRNAAGAAVNISSYTTIDWAMYPSAGGAAVVTKTGTLLAAGAGGQFTVELVPADTNDLAPDNYDMECQIRGTGIRNTIFFGKLSLAQRYV